MREQIIKDITNKVMIKLESQKIELANFADIKTQIDKAENAYNDILNYTNKIYGLINEAKKNTNYELLFRIVNELQSDKKDFVTKVEALGIDTSKIPQPKQYDDAIKRISSLAERGKKMYLEFK